MNTEVPMPDLEGCDFCKFVNYENSDDIFLYELGTCACDPGYSYEHYIVNRCILHFVIRGKGCLVLDGHKYIVQEHQAFLIPENARAFYQADVQDPWEYVWFHIGGPKVTSILREAGISYNNPIFTPLACAKEIEELAFDTLHNYKREYYCIGNLYKIFDYMVANSKDKVEKTVSNSLQEYLIVYRMKIASKLLLDTDLTVQTIAGQVGYSDAFTFTKAFKRHTGKSPSDYRRLEKKSPEAESSAQSASSIN